MMNNEADQFRPGDRVRVTMDTGRFCDDSPDQTFMDTTRGSIGTIVTFEEFQAEYLVDLLNGQKQFNQTNASFLEQVEQNIRDQFMLPIKFELVAPSDDPEAVVCCQTGKIHLIHTMHLGLTGPTPILEKII
jgi:hypothetical protein